MSVLEKLKAKKAAHINAANEIDKDIQELERLGPLAAKYGLAVVEAPAPSRIVEAVGIATGESTARRAKRASLEIIKQLGRPVPLPELYDQIVALGVQIGGAKPRNSLSAYLARTPELISTDRGWWLKDQPMPPNKTRTIMQEAGEIFLRRL